MVTACESDKRIRLNRSAIAHLVTSRTSSYDFSCVSVKFS